MPDIPITELIVQAVADRLRQIRQPAFHTDIGASVNTEPTWMPPEDAENVVIFDASKIKSGGSGVRSEREYVGIIEATLPCGLDDVARRRRLVDDDIEKALDGWLWQTGALPIQVDESVYLDKPDGLPVIAVQITFSTRFR